MDEEALKLKESSDHPILTDAGEALPPSELSEHCFEFKPEFASSPAASPTANPKKSLPDRELAAIAMHPNSSEEDWLSACAALNERELEPQIEMRKRSNLPGTSEAKSAVRRRRIVVFGTLFLLFAAFCFSVPLLRDAFTKAPQTSSEKPVPYIISQANWQNEALKRRIVVQIAQTIHKNGWTEDKAASFLSLEKSRISDLMNGRPSDFTADELNRMMFALGLTVSLPDFPTAAENNEMVEYCTRALDLDPDNYKALQWRARAYERLRKYDLQVADANQCVAIEPTLVGSWIGRSIAYTNTKQYQKALDDLNEIQKRFPEEDIYQNRALINLELNKLTDSISDSTKSIENMKEPRPGPYINRAVAYEMSGKIDKATSDLETVLKIDPTYRSAKDILNRLRKK